MKFVSGCLPVYLCVCTRDDYIALLDGYEGMRVYEVGMGEGCCTGDDLASEYEGYETGVRAMR